MTANTSPEPHLFVFDLDRAILAQLIDALEISPRLPLTKNAGPRLTYRQPKNPD